ncbi:MAG: hypothetical protein GXO76_13690 [Calditrichaeota bacterium]|nr:hypothetical protein [Calditrichota bacterium]
MKRTSKVLFWFTGFLIFTTPAFSRPTGTAEILRKMVHANQTTAYEGDWITQVDTVRIWQKIYQDTSGKRHIQFILPLSFMGKEIIEIPPSVFIRKKKGQKFRKRTLLFHRKLFSHAISKSQMALILKNYNVSVEPSGVFLGRKTVRLSLIPKIGDRPSLYLRLDRNTFFLLKLKKIAPDGKLIQYSYFKNLLLNPVLDPVLFTILPDEIDSVQAGFSRTFASADSLQKVLPFPVLLPEWLPEGFQPQAFRLLRFRKREFAQLIFSDGLSTLSLFEKKARVRLAKRKYPAVSSHMGVWEMRRNLGRTTVVLFGDLSQEALEKILHSFNQQRLNAKSSRNLILFVGLLVVALVMMVHYLGRKGGRR